MVAFTMTRNLVRTAATALALSAATVAPALLAQSRSMVAQYDRPAAANANIPAVLEAAEREHFRSVFLAIEREQWDQVEQLLEQRKDGLLYQTALAEYFTHANSPKIAAERISDWFKLGIHLPQTEQLARLGATRGLTDLPQAPRAQGFRSQPYAPKRTLPRAVNDGTMPAETRASILDRIKNDDPAGAHALLMEVDPALSPSARAEWRQRVAWSYYIENNDPAALDLASTVSQGEGDWVAEGEWAAGLAAWRLGDCARAGDAFSRAAARSGNVELTAAAHYWAHRSLIRCREPARAQDHLANAARFEETLYGMLAADQLGLNAPTNVVPKPFSRDDWDNVDDIYNVRIALALMEVGQPALADEVLRHQVRIGDPRSFEPLSRLARDLGLPSTQLFMAHNAPYGQRSDASLRFPVAHWQPSDGWKVDPSLAFAHALQESNFSARAVSPANARGLMQITPITVRQHAPRLNMSASYVDLNDPEVNLSFGQRNLEMLRDDPSTQGRLPKIMAAYNAGTTPVSRWNYEVRDQNDPLLYMESIPYWETRSYVAIVMRNYWMYERAAGVVASPSKRALAQGLWPSFPDAVRTRTAQADR